MMINDPLVCLRFLLQTLLPCKSIVKNSSEATIISHVLVISIVAILKESIERRWLEVGCVCSAVEMQFPLGDNKV